MVRSYSGISATDTHQQESEFISLRFSIKDEMVCGEAGIYFGSSYDPVSEIVYEFKEFTGSVTQVEIKNVSFTMKVSLLKGTFSCHFFNVKDLIIKIDKNHAYLSSSEDSECIILYERK